MNQLFQMKKDYQPEECLLQNEENMQWFRDAKFGLFIHWGIYALPAQGEWEMFNHRINVSEYAKLAHEFEPELFNADEWANCRKADLKVGKYYSPMD